VSALRLSAVAAAATALALGGCGEDRGGADKTDTQVRPQPKPPPPDATFAVAEKEYKLSPDGARLDRPASVEIHVSNEGRKKHALAVDGPHGLQATTPLRPGADAVMTVKLDRPGRYVWFCPIGDHKKRGMRGAIVVKESTGTSAAPKPATPKEKPAEQPSSGY
jgi:plastocyanin